MEIEENDREVTELLNAEYKKPKKTKYENLFLAKKIKRVKDTSDFGLWMKDVLKKRLTDTNQIKSYIEGKFNRTPSESIQSILSMLGRTKVTNGKMVLSDNFANKPLYFYVNYDKIGFNVFSNDDLFLAYFYKKVYDYYVKSSPNSDILPFMSDGIIVKAYFISKAFIYDGEIKKGYYQDFQANFSAIGVDILTEQERNKLMNPTQQGLQFRYKGINYSAYDMPGPVVIICKSSDNLDTEKTEMANGYKQLRIFNKGKDVTLNAKEIKIGKKTVRYIDMRIKPESFCPSFLIMFKEVKCTLIYKMKFDLNQLFADLDTAYKAKKGFAFYKNSCYWDTMESWYDFLSIYALTSKVISDNDRKILTGYVSIYHSNKSLFVIWQRMQLFLQKIYKLFYSSFSNHIDKYKIKKVQKGLSEYLGDLEKLEAEKEDYVKVENLIKGTSLFGAMMARQFEAKIMEIPRVMYEAVKDLDLGKNVETLPTRFRHIALSLYQISLSYSNDPAFPIVLAQGAFLGDLKGGLDASDPLQTLVETYVGKEIKTEKTREQMNKIVSDVIANMDEYINTIVRNNVLKYIAQKKGLQITEENKNIIVKAVYDNIMKSDQVFNTIKDKIIDNKMKGIPIGSIDLPENVITKWIEIYLNTYNRNLLVDKINQDQEKINELDQKNKVLANTEIVSTGSQPANPPSRKSAIPLININTNIEGNEEIKIPAILKGSVFPIPKDWKPAVPPEIKIPNGETPGGVIPPPQPPETESKDQVQFNFNVSSKIPSVDVKNHEISSKMSPIGMLNITKSNIDLNKEIHEEPQHNIINYNKDAEEKIIHDIDNMDIESISSDVDKVLKYKESFIEEKKEENKTSNPFPQKKINQIQTSKKYIKDLGKSIPKYTKGTSKKKNVDIPFPQKKLNEDASSGQLIRKGTTSKGTSKKKSQLDLELEKIKAREDEYNKIKSLKAQEGYDFDSFISQDYGKASMKNRKSLLADIVHANPQPNKSFYLDSRRLKVDKDEINKLSTFYKHLLEFIRRYGYIDAIPQNLDTPLRQQRSGIERLKYLYQRFPISDNFLDNLASESPMFISSKELVNYIKNRSWKKGIRTYDPFKITAPTVVRDLMNEEYKYWPVYKPPKEAEEVDLSYGQQGMSKSGTETSNADDLEEVD